MAHAVPFRRGSLRSTSNLILAAVILLYLVYAGIFIYQSSFVVDGVRYFALFDDSMISMTYARNLARGAGLVWNAGQPPVEGYTNPLWVVYMAFWHLFPIPTAKISLVIQISGALCVAGSLVFLKKFVERLTGGSTLAVALTLLLTAFYYPLSNWSLLGTEVSVLLLVSTAAAWMALRQFHEKRFDPWLFILLGASTLVRMDMAVPYGVAWLWLLLADPANRRKTALWGPLILAGFIGGQTLFRLAYYGEWLPMTYYLKMTGMPLLLRLRVGLYTFGEFILGLKWFLVAVPLVTFIFRRDWPVLLALGFFAGQAAYSIYVGGDSWEHRGGANRFVALGMPFFMFLFVEGGRQLGLFLLRFLKKLRIAPLLVNGALAALCLLAVLYFNRLDDSGSLRYSLDNLGESNLRYALLLERSIYVPGTERYARDGLILRELTSPQATLAVIGAGNVIYFADRPGIDLLGKSDAVIAKESIQIDLDAPLADFRPGHIKFDYRHSLVDLQPDVVVELRKSTVADGEALLGNYRKVTLNGHTMYLKMDSSHILWERVSAASVP